MELQTEKQIEQQYINLEIDVKGFVVFMQFLGREEDYVRGRLKKLHKERKSKEDGQRMLKEMEDKMKWW